MFVEISRIKVTESAQARVNLNPEVISHYTDLVRNGVELPPVALFFDGGDYWLADGFHRVRAFTMAGCSEIPATVKDGGIRDAKRFSLSANHDHGLARTNADKRNSVMIALADEEWSKLSDNKISELCKVTQPFVSKIRNEGKQPKTTKTIQPKGVITVISEPNSPLESSSSVQHNPADYSDKDHLIDQLEESLQEVARENEELRDAIAVGKLSEVEQPTAAETITSLRKQVLVLEATLNSVTSSRDTYMNEVAELKKQCLMQRKQLDKLKVKNA